MKLIFKFLMCFTLTNCFCTNEAALIAPETNAIEIVSLADGVKKVTIGFDNENHPIKIAYRAKGVNDGRPVVVFSDIYFGMRGWDCQMEELSEKFYVIAFDSVGYGLSTKNHPEDLDGVGGETGYSFRQQAVFLNKFLKKLNPHGPITYVGCDIQGQSGMWYTIMFANDPLKIEKLALIDTAPAGIVGDDPCLPVFLNSATAAFLAESYSNTTDPTKGPCNTLCLILGESFLTIDCPEIGPVLKQQSVNYLAQTPADIYTRVVTQTFAENIAGLMEQITIPVTYYYGGAGDVTPISR